MTIPVYCPRPAAPWPAGEGGGGTGIGLESAPEAKALFLGVGGYGNELGGARKVEVALGLLDLTRQPGQRAGVGST